MNSRSIIGKLLSIATLGVILSGCVVTPLALISPAVSGFNTTAIIKSGVTAGTNHLVKKRTGKTITDIFEQNLNWNVNKIWTINKERKKNGNVFSISVSGLGNFFRPGCLSV